MLWGAGGRGSPVPKDAEELCLEAELGLGSVGWESDRSQVQEEDKANGSTSLQIQEIPSCFYILPRSCAQSYLAISPERGVSAPFPVWHPECWCSVFPYYSVLCFTLALITVLC